MGRGDARLVVLGDLHDAYTADDTAWINATAPDAVLLVGDLVGGWSASPPACASALAALRPPTLWIPGNHDGVTPAHLVAEALAPGAAPEGMVGDVGARVAAVQAALGGLRRVAYEAVDLGAAWVLAARPHSMGGPSLAFTPYLRRAYGVDSLAASTQRLVALLEGVPDDAPVIWLAHNGPAGLGSDRDSIFGRDFRAPAVDWGDPDLRDAVAASRNGRRLVVVVAGHMHHRLRGGGERAQVVQDGDLLVLNTAAVPRITPRGRRHVELVVSEGRAEAAAVWVRQDGGLEREPLGVAARPAYA